MTVIIDTSRPRGFRVFLDSISPEVETVMKRLQEKPELQRLSMLVENNAYHDSENVFEHLQATFINCQELLSLEFVESSETKKRYEERLSQKIDGNGIYQRRDLLLIASGLHDIGKGAEKEPGQPYLEVVDEAGNTKASGHEHAGGVVVPELLAEFDFTAAEIVMVQSLVDWHDTFSETYCRENLSKEVERDVEKMQRRHPLFSLELLVHILADNWGAAPYVGWQEYFIHELLQRGRLGVK